MMTDLRDTARQVARQVAAVLPEFDYPATEDDGNPRLVAEDGRALLFRIGNYGSENGRLIISGMYPQDHNRAVVTPHEWDHERDQKREWRDRITVAPDKSPEKIAADITRRLLPDYNEGYANAQSQIAERLDSHTGSERLAQRLGEAAGVEPRQGTDEFSLYTPGLPFRDIRISGPNNVRFEYFYCTADQAEAIIRALKD